MSRIEKAYELACELYREHGVDPAQVLEKVDKIPVALHAWQGDDVVGFENFSTALTGGCQVTGNHPGRARSADELRRDLDLVLKLVPGTHRVCLQGHQVDKMLPGVDRDGFTMEHFSGWRDWAKAKKIAMDIAPCFYSHPKLDHGFSLSHPDPAIRRFWIGHGLAIRRIGEGFGKALGIPAVCNFWMPDGFKDEPSDRLAPRRRMAESLDRIFAAKYDRRFVVPTLESKLFGIGVESYTVGSHEFVMGYAATRKILALLDMGHFHLSESVADKISSFLMTFGKVAFHISRPVRWDSDHVIRQNDDLRACAREIVRMGPENFIVALDYFDASINRVAAWVLGMRNMQKELLKAMLVPWKDLAAMKDRGDFTALLVLQEEYGNYPAEEVWAEFCRRAGVASGEEWFGAVRRYERDVLLKR